MIMAGGLCSGWLRQGYPAAFWEEALLDLTIDRVGDLEFLDAVERGIRAERVVSGLKRQTIIGHTSGDHVRHVHESPFNSIAGMEHLEIRGFVIFQGQDPSPVPDPVDPGLE